MFSKEKIAYIFLILATLFWSGNFIVGKAASSFDIPPFTLNFYRWLFAWLILAPFTLKEIYESRFYLLDNLKYVLILGITSITLFNSIVYYSLQFTQVISGVLMISTIPVMIIFFSSLLKIEKTNFYQIMGVIFSMLGVVVIVTQLNEVKIRELILILCATIISFSAYAIIIWSMKYEPIGFVASMRESSIIFASLLGLILLREKIGYIRIISGILFFIGVGFIFNA